MNKIKALLITLFVVAAILVAGYFYLLHPTTIAQPSLSATLQTQTITINGHKRTYHYYLPENVKATPALVFVFHSSLSNGNTIRQRTAYQFDVIADKKGFIVVYPDGYQRHWNDCRASADYAANTENINDVKFVSKIIDWFATQHQINTKRVYATGYSNGGHLSFRLAMETPNLVAAIAPIAANLPIDKNLDCKKSGQPVAVALFNGTADAFNPHHGGLVSILGNDSRGKVLSSQDTINYWLNLAGYQNSIGVKKQLSDINLQDSSTVEKSTWIQDSGPEISLYTLQGGGHTIPSKRVRLGGLFGQTNGDIEAAHEVWKFFERDWQQDR